MHLAFRRFLSDEVPRAERECERRNPYRTRRSHYISRFIHRGTSDTPRSMSALLSPVPHDKTARAGGSDFFLPKRSPCKYIINLSRRRWTWDERHDRSFITVIILRAVISCSNCDNGCIWFNLLNQYGRSEPALRRKVALNQNSFISR